jgi:hypothetical protein
MLRRIRTHLTPGTAIALIALVFAFTGGAFAATGGGNNNSGLSASAHASVPASVAKRKAKSKTKAGPRGPAGPAGKNGTNGAPGATGPAGPAGANGTGTPGVEGKQGIQGIEGKEGKQGTPGTNGTTGYTETLPSEKTETGTWSFSEPGGSNEALLYASISFAIPLKQTEPHPSEVVLEASHVIYVGIEELLSKTEQPQVHEDCPSENNHNAGEATVQPEAAPGYLCVYEGFTKGVKVEHEGTSEERAEAEIIPAGLHGLLGVAHGAGSTGALVKFEEQGEGTHFGGGTWAVTAP